MGYFMFDKRRLAGDPADAVCQGNRVIVHRRQAASHGPVFAARQRFVEDVVAPPTKHAFSQILSFCPGTMTPLRYGLSSAARSVSALPNCC